MGEEEVTKLKTNLSNQIAKLVNEYKLERGCAHCGYKEKALGLDFHHENREDKIINVSSHWKTSWKQYEKMKEEMKKCIVLCSNCHREHHTKHFMKLKN